MNVTLTVDVKELYKVLCPECRKKMVKLVKVKLDEEVLLKLLEG